MEEPKENAPKEVGYEAALKKLTPREIEVLELVGKGYTYKQTAETLALSVHTIHSEVKNIKNKLNVDGYRGLVPWYQEIWGG